MGKKKKGGILGSRTAASLSNDTQSAASKKTRAKPEPGAVVKTEAKQQRADAKASALNSPLQQQCAVIVARLLYGMKQRRSSGSLKTLCLAPNVQNKRAVYAVVCETLKHHALLQQILDRSRVCEEHPQLTRGAGLVLLYDHLVGQGVKPRGPHERTFLSYSPVFKELAQQLLLQQPGATKLSDLLMSNQAAPQPSHRTARVNLLLTTAKVVKQRLSEPCSSWGSEFQKPTPAEDVRLDEHLPDVFSLPEKILAHNHPLVESGHVVLQGKASCMPACALNPCKGWKVLDCCAAPGNKTTHLAALVGAEGSVIAFEKDQRRFDTLKRTLARCKAPNVQPVLGDFLEIDPRSTGFRDVRAVLLDPSCSGSGTVSTRLDHLLPTHSPRSPGVSPAEPGTERNRSTIAASGSGEDTCWTAPTAAGTETTTDQSTAVRAAAAVAAPAVPEAERKRVAGLVSFQTRALQHALSFPSAERVVYSTCSVYQEENEAVVAAVLPAAEAAGFSLMHALPQWPRRGAVGSYGWADDVVRVDPALDGMDGFFVAVFERL